MLTQIYQDTDLDRTVLRHSRISPHNPPAADSLTERDLIGVFFIITHRNAALPYEYIRAIDE